MHHLSLDTPSYRFIPAHKHRHFTISVGGGQPGTSAAHADAHLTIQGEQKLPE
jgi:hypothetical protein